MVPVVQCAFLTELMISVGLFKGSDAVDGADLIASVVPVNQLAEEVPSPDAVIQVKHRPGWFKVAAAVDVLLCLAGQGETEAVALTLDGADAHYAADVAAVERSGVADDLDGPDVFGHKVAQFGVVGNLSPVDIILRRAPSYDFESVALVYHSRHLAEHIQGVAAMLKDGAGDIGDHRVTFYLRPWQRSIDYRPFEHLRIGTKLHCFRDGELGGRNFHRAISYH